MNTRLGSLVLLVFAAGAPAVVRGADFYVSPNATGSGDGSLANPWTLIQVLKPAPAVKPGDTIYLRAGRYRSGASTTPFRSYLTGAAAAPITLRPYPGEHVIFDGNLEILRAGVILRDFEFLNSDGVRHTSQTGSWPTDLNHSAAIWVAAADVKIINCVIHDAGFGIGSWVSAPNTEVYGNVVYYNGWKAPDRPHGHGIYAQNLNGSKHISDNIFHNNFSHGIQVYGSSNSALNNFVVDGNIAFENGSLGGSGSRNILLGGTAVAKDPVVANNYTYYGSYWGDVNIGYWSAGAGCTNARITNNYFAGGDFSLNQLCQVTAMTGNVLAAQLRGFSPATFPNNQYGSQSKLSVFVRPNKYEAGRANIAIFNWPRLQTVSVDVSAAGLQVGDVYELRNALNYYGDVITGTYSGQPIAVPMTGRTVAQPIGISPPLSPYPVFGAFVLRKKGATAEPPPQPPPPTTEEPAPPPTEDPDPPPATEEPAPPPTTEEPAPPPPTSVWVQYTEAESGARYSTVLAYDLSASGSKAVSYPSATASQIFKRCTPGAGAYMIWVRVKPGRFAVSVDGGPPAYFRQSGASGWHWERLEANWIFLERGWRTLKFTAPGAPGLLDGFVITNDLSYVPPADPRSIPR